MAKTRTHLDTKGRWLEVDTKSKSRDQVLAAVKKIGGAEIRELSGKTYIRFPAFQPQKGVSAFQMIKIAYSRPSAKKRAEGSNFRQYCAVIHKNK